MPIYASDTEDLTTYSVVVNHEEQYSIWPADRQPPAGWQAVDKSGSKAECLEYIDGVWTDLRPLSLRLEMAKWEKERDLLPEREVSAPTGPKRIPLPERLEGLQAVELALSETAPGPRLRQAIEDGFVYLRFSEQFGRTEIGFALEPSECDIANADFEKTTGQIHFVGHAVLDYVPLQCIADLSLASMSGTARIVRGKEPVR